MLGVIKYTIVVRIELKAYLVNMRLTYPLTPFLIKERKTNRKRRGNAPSLKLFPPLLFRSGG